MYGALAGLSEPSLLPNAMSTTFSREDAIIFRSTCHAFLILNIRSAGSSEPSLLANILSTTFSREGAIVF